MSDKIEPALSEKEWADALAHEVSLSIESPRYNILSAWLFPDGRMRLQCGSIDDAGEDIEGRGRHQIAALALHGQPFGYTWEDIKLLEMVTDYVGSAIQDRAEMEESALAAANNHPLQVALRNLAARVGALLPPEGK